MGPRYAFALVLVVFSVCVAELGSARAQDEFAANIRTTEPLTPEQERESFSLPPGFEVQLVASEPDIWKPMNLAFDGKGRLWVTDSTEYPFAVPADQAGRDSIKILEDADGDGFAEKITTFADGLNIPIGLYPYKNGCIVFSIPHIWWLEDTDGDDVADRRERLYGPMGFERDTHGLNNAFRRGFDGWLYACHGFNNQTTVSGRDGHVIEMQSGNTYRMRLNGERVEQFTWGQVNPFGMSLDPYGNLFTADCHSKPIYQLLRGGRYPSFGKPHDGLGFVEPMMDHLHGSTAIAGLSYYGDVRFPTEYQGNFFSGNVMTSRVNRDAVRYEGSTPKAIEQLDFMTTSDPWFRPVDVRMGPDGALYIADFYNRIIGHYEVDLKHEGRDRHSGRIWRVVYRGEDADSVPPLVSTSLEDCTLDDLFSKLSDKNLTMRMLALHEICDLADGDNTAEILERAEAVFHASDVPEQRAACMWVLHRVGESMEVVARAAMEDESELLRMHAVRVLADVPEWSVEHEGMATEALSDDSPKVQQIAAEAWCLHRSDHALEQLMNTYSEVDARDSNLGYMLRRAMLHQLSHEDGYAQVETFASDASALQLLAGVSIAIPNEHASRFLLDCLEQGVDLGELETIEVVRHIARHCTEPLADELIALVRQTYADEMVIQVELIQTIRNSLVASGLSPPASLANWATELIEQLLPQIVANIGTWQNLPVPNRQRRDNPWTTERRRSADGDRESLFFGSLPAGEQATGILSSMPFEIPASLSFYCAGHVGHPSEPATAISSVRLVAADTGKVLIESLPPRNDVAQRIEWDLSEFEGREGRIEIVDGDQRNAFAWLAVGRFEPAVVEVSRVSPRLVAIQFEAAVQLATLTTDRRLGERFATILTQPGIDAQIRQMLAAYLVQRTNAPLKRALPVVIGDAEILEPIRIRLVEAVVRPSEAVMDEVIKEVYPVLSSKAQLLMLRQWAATAEGQSLIKELVAAEQVGALALRDTTLLETLRVAEQDALIAEMENAAAKFPSPTAEIEATIASRLEFILERPGEFMRGHETFKRQCANCHQVGGEGAEIGPQLDGIGNRGLARVLEDVLDPNRNVDAAFRSSTIITVDGDVFVGLQRREDGNTLVFADREGKEFRVERDDIDELQKSANSLMPNDVVAEMEPREFADLMAYLMQQRADNEE